jgi:hypothetical protein
VGEVTVVEVGDGSYAVTVVDGGRSHGYRVRVPTGLPARLGCAHVPVTDLVRSSFSFLLAREPPSSILRNFSLEQIADYFPDYPDTIGRTLA